MSSLGYQTIYREIHLHPQASAERAFLPDDIAAYRKSKTQVFTYEGRTPLGEFAVAAFSMAYELEITGLLEMLELSGVPRFRSERDNRHPFVLVGGPLTNSNPAPLAPFADLIILGEAEELIQGGPLAVAQRREAHLPGLVADVHRPDGAILAGAVGQHRLGDAGQQFPHHGVVGLQARYENPLRIGGAQPDERAPAVAADAFDVEVDIDVVEEKPATRSS